jgi:hypothetical protein
MIRICMVFLALFPLALAAQTKASCGCKRYPFTPQPPCARVCWLTLVLRADRQTLTEIVSLPGPVADRLLQQQRQITESACGTSAFRVGKAREPNYDKAEEGVIKVIGNARLNNLYEGKLGTRDGFPAPANKDPDAVAIAGAGEKFGLAQGLCTSGIRRF